MAVKMSDIEKIRKQYEAETSNSPAAKLVNSGQSRKNTTPKSVDTPANRLSGRAARAYTESDIEKIRKDYETSRVRRKKPGQEKRTTKDPQSASLLPSLLNMLGTTADDIKEKAESAANKIDSAIPDLGIADRIDSNFKNIIQGQEDRYLEYNTWLEQ